MSKAMRMTAFERQFDPEHLAVRKDMPKCFLACARGDFQAVVKMMEEDESQMQLRNRDGNTMLLIAVANQHIQITNLLLELSANITQKNVSGMDALDYAIIDGIRKPIAKAVFSHCEYLVPDPVDGPYWQVSDQALANLQRDNIRVARTSLIGRTPSLKDDHRLNPDEDAYKVDWVRSLVFIASSVKKGILLLSSDIGYLERDALLTGCLMVPQDRTFVYNSNLGKVVSFRQALKREDFYADIIEQRLMEACQNSDALAVQGLLKARAPANLQNVYGTTALMIAARKGSLDITRCLIRSKAKVDTANKDGYSPLLMAAVGDHANCVRILLRAKADPFAKTYKGNSVVTFVKHEGHGEILRIIHQEQDARRARGARQGQAPAGFRPPARGLLSTLFGAGFG